MDIYELMKQVNEWVKEILQDNYVGVYFHGSLRLGSFNPNKSDLDFIQNSILTNLYDFDNYDGCDPFFISFSRIKEELKNGAGLTTAFKLGTKQSIMSIVDANLTTLLAAIILFIFGESSVKGFATMLIISIVVTFIVMVFLVRYLVGLFVRSDKFNKHRFLFIGYKEKKTDKKGFDFIKYHKIVIAFVSLIIVAGGIFIYTSVLLTTILLGGIAVFVTISKLNIIKRKEGGV